MDKFPTLSGHASPKFVVHGPCLFEAVLQLLKGLLELDDDRLSLLVGLRGLLQLLLLWREVPRKHTQVASFRPRFVSFETVRFGETNSFPVGDGQRKPASRARRNMER